MQKTLLLIFGTFFMSTLAAQKAHATQNTLSNQFTDYELVRINSNTLFQQSKQKNGALEFSVEIQGNEYELELFKQNVLSENYKLVVATDQGTYSQTNPSVINVVGYVKNSANSRANFTIDKDYLLGWIKIDHKEYYIESLSRFQDNLDKQQFVVYEPKNVVSKQAKCAHNEIETKKSATQSNVKAPSGCYEVEYAVASDHQMYMQHGNSVSNVENHVIAVTSLVNTDYDTDYFSSEIQFQIVEQYVSTSLSTDHWLSNGAPTEMSILLNDFASWGTSGFSNSFDLASLWTGYDLNNTTVGMAFVGVVCNFSRYNVIENFTSSMADLRAVTSHEIGHNFNASHDGAANLIMSGSNTGSSTWSSASVSSIEAYLASVSCLSACTPSNPCSIDALLTVTDATSNSSNDGSAVANVSGSSGSHSFAWSNGANTPSISNLAPGTYYLTLTDANVSGCQDIDTAVVGVANPCNLSASASTTAHESIAGANDGSVTVNATNGYAPYTYLWSNGATSQSVTNLAPATYTVTVTDNQGCSEVSSTAVNAGAACNMSVNATSQDESSPGANDGSISAAASGGTTPYTYFWSNGATTQTIINLAPGNYSVTVTDQLNCSATTSATIQGASCTLSATAQVINHESIQGANDGAAVVNVTGGTTPYSYLWSSGQTLASISNLPPATYTVTVTDANGCTDVSSISINAGVSCNLSLSLSAQHESVAGANDGTITSNVSSGAAPYNYAWSNNASTQHLVGLSPGNYSLTITDQNGCTVQATTTVNAGNCSLSLNITTQDETSAGQNDGSASVSANGQAPYSYQWSNNQTGSSIQNLAPSTYVVTVTDNNGCQEIGFAVINAASGSGTCSLSVSISGQNANIGASDGAATATANSGTAPYTYVWSNGQTTQMIGSLSAGTYSVTITDAENCTAVNSVVIIEQNNTLYNTQLEDSLCNTSVSATTNLYCQPVANATNYMWKITNTGNGQITEYTRSNHLNNFQLAWVQNLTNNTSYSIEVRAMVSGVWGNYSESCNVTYTAAPLSVQNIEKLQLNIYPNPLTEESLHIDFSNNTHVKSLEIYAINGQRVFNQIIDLDVKNYTLNPMITEGSYFIVVQTDYQTLRKSFIKL